MKRGIFRNAYWSLILLIAFAAVQLLPALFQPIHQYIYWSEQTSLAHLDAGSSSLESLRMTEASFAAIQEEEHEITWNGKRYDIKSIQYHDGIVELLVKHDSLETKLENIVQLIQGSSERPAGPHSTQHFYAFYFERLHPICLVIPARMFVQLQVGTTSVEQNPRAVIAPPPRV